MLDAVSAEERTTVRIAFVKPPVIEAVLGVEFPAIPWSIEHFGLFWSTVRDRFPKFEPQAPIIPVSAVPGVQFQLGPLPVRGWYIDQSESRVIQVQLDRFNYNWRERPGQGRYPLYATLRPEFESEWSHFLKFLRESGFQPPAPTQASVTYVNHIPRGSGWATANDLGNIIRVWDQSRLPDNLSETQFVNLAAGYKLASGKSVRFDVQPGLRINDKTDVVQLTIVVSGKLDSMNLLNWFDDAERELVQCFVDFTTDDIQYSVWERKN